MAGAARAAIIVLMTIRLLLPFDGSPAAARAAELVSSFDVQATLLNVQSPPLRLWPGAGLDPAALDLALGEAGRAALEPARSRLPGARAEVRIGLPADAILSEAAGHDAVVMGTRGAGLLQGYALGSVALRVAHGARAPVLLVKPQDRLPAAPGERLRVLLAMDGSAPALRAAERLVAWREWLGELEVHLVWVQQPLSYLATVLPPHDDVIGQWSTQEGRERTQAARELFRAAGVAQHLHLTVGDPALEAKALAGQTGAELVALGTRGLGAAHHALIGSVALKAAALCEVPVMLVP
jgi:nucleotide-binding universal stress UspA family protein